MQKISVQKQAQDCRLLHTSWRLHDTDWKIQYTTSHLQHNGARQVSDPQIWQLAGKVAGAAGRGAAAATSALHKQAAQHVAYCNALVVRDASAHPAAAAAAQGIIIIGGVPPAGRWAYRRLTRSTSVLPVSTLQQQ